MTCQHHPWGEPTGATCTRPVGHEHGHVYSNGSWVDDRHLGGGHG